MRTTARCNRCKQDLPREAFSPSVWEILCRPPKKGGCRWCRDCMRAYSQSPERRAYQRTTGQDHKAAGLEARRALVGAIRAVRCCQQCGEADPACLDFHHRDPSHKLFSVAFLASQGYSVERIMAEIEKCDLLCANCHRKLEAGQRAQRKATTT